MYSLFHENFYQCFLTFYLYTMLQCGFYWNILFLLIHLQIYSTSKLSLVYKDCNLHLSSSCNASSIFWCKVRTWPESFEVSHSSVYQLDLMAWFPWRVFCGNTDLGPLAVNGLQLTAWSRWYQLKIELHCHFLYLQ